MLALGLTNIDLIIQQLILDAERVLPDAQTLLTHDKFARSPSESQSPSHQDAEVEAAVQTS